MTRRVEKISIIPGGFFRFQRARLHEEEKKIHYTVAQHRTRIVVLIFIDFFSFIQHICISRYLYFILNRILIEL